MNALRFVRVNTLISYIALLIFMIVDLLINPPTASIASLVVIIILKCLPLLLPVVGVARGNVRSHSWLCFIVMIYFISGVLRTTTPTQLVWGLVEIFLSVEIFICAMLYVRWKKSSM